MYQDTDLKTLRKKLRNGQTEAEYKLWQVLRKSQLGFKFIRQYSVGKFILYFYCPFLLLAIELDGSQHMLPENLDYDAKRTEFLNNQNITVLRFYDNEIFNNIEGVVERILQTINKISPP